MSPENLTNTFDDGIEDDDDDETPAEVAEIARRTALAGIAGAKRASESERATYELWICHALRAGCTFRAVAEAADVSVGTIQHIARKGEREGE